MVVNLLVDDGFFKSALNLMSTCSTLNQLKIYRLLCIKGISDAVLKQKKYNQLRELIAWNIVHVKDIGHLPLVKLDIECNRNISTNIFHNTKLASSLRELYADNNYKVIGHLQLTVLHAMGTCGVRDTDICVGTKLASSLRELRISNNYDVKNVGHLQLTHLDASFMSGIDNASLCAGTTLASSLQKLNIACNPRITNIKHLGLVQLNASGYCKIDNKSLHGPIAETLRILNVFNNSGITDVGHLQLEELYAGGRLCGIQHLDGPILKTLKKIYIMHNSSFNVRCLPKRVKILNWVDF